MASQDQIKHHVAAVRSEARSLIARYRAERQAKYARPVTNSAAAPAAEAPAAELAAAAQPTPAPAPAPMHARVHTNSTPAFSASPSIERLLAGRTPSEPATPAQTQATAPTRPSMPGRAANADPATLLGLEPLIARQGETLGNVLSAAPSTRKSASPGGLKRGQAEALGLMPLIDFSVQHAPGPQAARRTPPAAAPAEPAAPSSAATAAAALHPLSAIAAIGPGLKLKLSEIGVGSIEDLAAASEAELREKLGAIGALVRLDVWIKEAQDLVAASHPK